MNRLSAVKSVTPELIATATLGIDTSGPGFFDFTRDAARFLAEAGAGEGALFAYLRHTSASLVIQENADPDVQTDLVTALERLAPADAPWVHDTEGPDDMLAHVKSMVNGVSLHVPVIDGRLAVGTWQGLYLASTALIRTGARSCCNSSAAGASLRSTFHLAAFWIWRRLILKPMHARRTYGVGAMALIDHLPRRTIRDQSTAGAFIDEQAFHLAESCVLNYSRLRAGAGAAETLFADPQFAAALEKACWEAYPRALVMVGTVAEAALRPYGGRNAHAVLYGLITIILDRFDRRPVPRAIGSAAWRAARADVMRSLNNLARSRPKSAEAVARDHSSFYLAIMPLHPQLGGDDFGALTNQLKLTLSHVRDAFTQRSNLLALAGEFSGRMPKVETSEALLAPA